MEITHGKTLSVTSATLRDTVSVAGVWTMRNGVWNQSKASMLCVGGVSDE